MPAAPGSNPLSIAPSLSLPSMATADATSGGGLFEEGFSVDFGDKNSGKGGTAGANPMNGGPSMITGLVRDLTVGVTVALIARWAWGKLK